MSRLPMGKTSARTSRRALREPMSRSPGGLCPAAPPPRQPKRRLPAKVQADEAARAYWRVLHSLPVAAVLRSGERLTLNRAAERLTGRPGTELPTVGDWCRALHGHDAGARGRYEPSAAPDAAPVRVVRQDGEVRHVLLTVAPLDDIHTLWTLVDVAAPARPEAALNESGEYLRSIIDTVADAIITVDAHGTIDVFNPAAERFFGYSAAEAASTNLRELMPPPQREAAAGPLARCLAPGEPRVIETTTEVTAVRKDGTVFPAQLTVGEIDHLGRYVCVLHDLRARRALEWRLAESQTEERRHMARELHDEIGGHITGIGLLAQTLQSQLASQRSPLSAQAQDVVDTIAAAHKRLRGVVRGLMPVEAVPEGLAVALADLTSQCQSVTGITCRLRCDMPAPIDDPATALHLYRIAQEAVNNAVRHAHPGEIVVALSRADDGIEIAVSDDGRGLRSAVTHDGIGLKGMQQRARLLGGDCVFERRPGRGTIVRCWAPLTGPRPDGAAATGPTRT